MAGTVSWGLFPRRRRPDTVDADVPEEPCPRCGEPCVAGYLTASSFLHGRVYLGWIAGSPSWRRGRGRDRARVLDSRMVSKPARWPAHHCPGCRFTWFAM